MKNEIIRYDDGTFVKIGAYNIKQFTPHWHDTDIEVVFVLEGKVFVNAVYDNFEVNAGEFVVINHEDIHLLQSHEDNVTFLIHIDLNAFENKYEFIMFLDLMCESFNVNSIQMEYTKQLKKLFIKMNLEFIKAKKNYKINDYAAEALDIIVQHFDIAHYYNDRPIHENQLHRYYRIMKSIALNYDEKISMETIAQEEYIGKNYISQFWKRMLGINFTDYLNSRRTEVAQKLLLSTDLNLQEISLRCGFSDSKYFYKNFKRWYGSTPAEHKTKYKNISNRVGNVFVELSKEMIAENYNRHLISLLVDEEGDLLEVSNQVNHNWRFEFEKNMNPLGRRIKREMIKETQKILGLREIFIPLLDKNVVQYVNGDISFDWNFIGEVIKYSKDMNYTICIDINYTDRSFNEWQSIIKSFASFVLSVMGKECLSRFRFYIFMTEIYVDAEVEELVNRMSEIIDLKSIKVTARYK